MDGDDGERERPVAAGDVPPSLAPLVAGRRWARDTVGEAGAVVHRLHAPGLPDLYLKHGGGEGADAVADEMARTRWLGRFGAAPAVAGFVLDAEGAWLLTTAVPGRTAYQVLEAEPAMRETVVDALAAQLRWLHALPVAACPYDAGLAVRLAHADARIAAGLVDEDEFDDARAGWSAKRVRDAIAALLPLPLDRVVTHGDYSLDNILLVDGRVAGLIDLGRLEVADPYQDLAILWNCLGEFSPALQDRLFAAYGATLDRRRLDVHLMLDELF